MNTLHKPRFRKLSHSECAGAPILRSLWDRFDFSLLLTQSGIFKRSGAESWLLCFLYVVGLVSGCTAVLQMTDLAAKDALLKCMFRSFRLAQYTMSRFFTTPFAWRTFGKKRVERMQQDKQTALQDGDALNLDDTLAKHPHAKNLPFLSWLYDHSPKAYMWGMNLVVLQAVLRNGPEYPLFYSPWLKPEVKGEGLTKFDLARQMLLMLRESVTCRLWVAMDRWYLCKDFFMFLEANGFDWVTKAKRNTSLFRKVIEPCTRRERYVPLTPVMLIKEVFRDLMKSAKTGLVSISIPDIYMKQPYTITNKKGKEVTKHRYVMVAAVVAARLKKTKLLPPIPPPVILMRTNIQPLTRVHICLSATGMMLRKKCCVPIRSAGESRSFSVRRNRNCHSKSVTPNRKHITMLISSCCLPPKPYLRLRSGN